MPPPVDFETIPQLDYALVSSDKPLFLNNLRNVLLNVGFAYLVNHSVDQDLINSMVTNYVPALFALPQHDKDKFHMVNSPHFLGYTHLGAELTKGAKDYREQFDVGTDIKCRWTGPADPPYYRLFGPGQWPDEQLIPGFRQVITQYMDQVAQLSADFTPLAAEALGLPPNGLDHFYDKPEYMQHRLKLSKYYPATESYNQGVGPHYDPGFWTFVLQASPHRCLQVQNLGGHWIDVPPIPGSLVFNFGKGLEFVTRGLARATSHRVLSPEGTTPRYSVALLQNIGLGVRLADSVLDFPPEVLKLGDARGNIGATDSINFSEFDREPSGQVHLIGRVKSHPEVGERYYPDIFKKCFPDGKVPS
jgi:isopenicillin N synthase-like dioxygenase